MEFHLQLPLNDPTFILNKTTHESVMQHNTIHGRTNKNNDKNMDLSTTSSLPQQTLFPPIAKSTIESTLTPLPGDGPPLDSPLDDSSPSNHVALSLTNECHASIRAGSFDHPIPPTANFTSIQPNQPTYPQSPSFSNLRFDPTNYYFYSSWLAQVPPSFFNPSSTSIEHNDGGADCFISNTLSHFISFIQQPLSVIQLDGSTVRAKG